MAFVVRRDERMGREQRRTTPAESDEIAAKATTGTTCGTRKTVLVDQRITLAYTGEGGVTGGGVERKRR